jgi:hypothetical protein
MFFGALRAIGFSGLVVAQADQFVAAVNAFTIAGPCGRFDRHERHRNSSGEDSSWTGGRRQEKEVEEGGEERREKREEDAPWSRAGRGAG